MPLSAHPGAPPAVLYLRARPVALVVEVASVALGIWSLLSLRSGLVAGFILAGSVLVRLLDGDVAGGLARGPVPPAAYPPPAQPWGAPQAPWGAEPSRTYAYDEQQWAPQQHSPPIRG